MKWLTPDDMVRLKTAIDSPLQTISIVANLSQLSVDIPILPQLVSEEEGLPSPAQRWCCQIESRFVFIEREMCPDSQIAEQVAIYTPFLSSDEKLGDWKTLLELQKLPGSIIVTRPLFIESRTTLPNCVVYRPDSRGWSDTVYRSFSYAEAKDFLSYLKKDAWNDHCYIGEPSPLGEWSIIVIDVDRERVIGAYAEKDLALKVACEMSIRQSIKQPISVKDLSGVHPSDVYKISSGRVLSNTPFGCGS
jgi:hypothetical protein